MSIERGTENDFLLAEYSLGVLDAADMARANELLANDADATATALKWENLFLELTDRLDPIEPPAHLLQRVQAALGHDITLIKRPSIWPRVLKKLWGVTFGGIWFWRALCVVLAITAVAYALKPNLAVINAPPPTKVAVLQAPGQTSTPGVLITFDSKNNLVLKPRVHIEIPDNAAVQLWTRGASQPQPRSLGVFKPNRTMTIPAATVGVPGKNQLFEITLEQAGGSATGKPSGPILFIGRLVELPAIIDATASTTPH
jgi:anti-sigma-K factor RskA